MNGANSTTNGAASNSNARAAKPPPTGPAPPVPTASAHGPPPNSSNAQPHTLAHPLHPHGHHYSHQHPPNRANGVQKGKKKPDTPVDPATMYESLKNRIQALEEEEVMEEEEERKFSKFFSRLLSVIWPYMLYYS